MCAFLYPNEYLDSTYQIDFKKLKEKGFRGVIFDIDNTLVPHGAPADERAVALFSLLKELDFQCVLLSNNKEPRVKSFAETVGAMYIYKAGKPKKSGYLRAMELMHTNVENTLFVGDQIFTDVCGANLAGIPTILVKPIHPKEEIQIVLKRFLEFFVLIGYRIHKVLTKNKKGLFCLLMMFFLGMICTSQAWAMEEAKVLEAEYTAEESLKIQRLSDGKLETWVELEKDESFTIGAKEPIGGIYIKWHQMAEDGISLESEKESIICGNEQIYHEYIELNGESLQYTLQARANCKIAELTVYSIGEVAPEVQLWKQMEGEADLLVLPAFAFHEALYFGGPIANYAKAGYKVQVMYMCDYKDEGAIARTHELLDCLWQMGVCWYPINAKQPELYSMTMEQAKTQYSERLMIDEIKQAIFYYEPLVVVGQDFQGEDKNCVHILWAECLNQALQELEASQGWIPQKVYYHNYQENQIVLDVTDTLEIIRQAYKCHKTQAFRTVIPSNDVNNPLNMVVYGLYKSQVGADTGNDMMEHVKRPEQVEEDTENSQVSDSTQRETAEIIEDVSDNKFDIIGKIGIVIFVVGFIMFLVTQVYTIIWRIRHRGEEK